MKKPKSPKLTAATTPRYTVKLAKLAQKQLDKLPDAIVYRINTAILKLTTEPRPYGVRKLQGSEEYRIRVGDYRVVYTIADKILTVEVVRLGQRGNFYDA